MPHRAGRKPHAGAEAQRQILVWIEAKPDLTLAEIQDKLRSQVLVRLSLPQIWHLLRKMGLRLKKVAHASERDSEANRKRRAEFAARICDDRAGAADFSGRERSHHFNDAAAAPAASAAGASKRRRLAVTGKS